MDTGCMVVREYAFAVEVQALAAEAYEWVDYQTARERLRSDSHRAALWELDRKLRP